MTKFHNPYNFVPVGSQDKLGEITAALGQGAPAGHHRYHAGHWTGRINIEIEVVTPLLIPDVARVQSTNNGHKISDMRTGPDGKALLPVTTLKGALRSAYEAITNSRFGVFGNERKVPPARRMLTQEALNLVPVRISGNATVAEQLHVANIRQYKGNVIKYRDGSSPQHGDPVECLIEAWEKRPPRPYKYWRVLAIKPAGDPAALIEPENYQTQYAPHHRLQKPNRQTVAGWVFKTDQSIKFKHDERVFFRMPGSPLSPFAVTRAHADQWKALIDDYKAVFARDGKNANAPRPASYTQASYRSDLFDEQLCFATTETLNGTRVLKALYPAMIGRELGHTSPWELLDDKFRPAQSRNHLSPADRVFGWVRQGGHGAHKGQLRIHNIVCTGPGDGIERPQTPLTLPILSTPKPSQARFYLGRDAHGTPLQGTDDVKKDGYFARPANGQTQTEWRLRGRKVYPHHRGAGPIANVPIGLAPSNQNRTVRAWVKQGTCFSGAIDVINLNAAELGALLWLLSLPQDTNGAPAHLRLGGGKPLGFGSVRVTIAGSQLRSGQAMALRYRDLKPAAGDAADLSVAAQTKVRQDAIAAFASEIGKAYNGGKFAGTPFIEAFLHAARGFADNHPTHYPLLAHQSVADGKSYEWFVDNNRLSKPLALGALADGDPALPRSPG